MVHPVDPNPKKRDRGKNEERAATMAGLDEAQHANVDAPIEPPVRRPPKATESKGVARKAESILSRLYDPDRMQKPALWTHVKLVAPGPVDQPPPGQVRWRSKDAVAAYCLKCKKQFT